MTMVKDMLGRNVLLVSLGILTIMFVETAQGQTGSISLDHVDGIMGTDSIAAFEPITFYLRVTNNLGVPIGGWANGFRVYSPDGAIWSPITYDTANVGWVYMADGGVFLRPYSVDGSGADTIGFAGFRFYEAGIPDGFDEVAFVIRTMVHSSNLGRTLCLDSSYFPPSGSWHWFVEPGMYHSPSWDGPHCFTIASRPSGSLTGTVTDAETGFAIPSASVHLVGYEQYGCKADEYGAYEIGYCPPRVHSIGANANGYQATEITDVEVVEGQATIQDISLSPLPPRLVLRSVEVQDSDDCLSPGDHATLILGFFNEGGAAENVEVTLDGATTVIDRPQIMFQDPSAGFWSYNVTVVVDQLEPTSSIDVTIPAYVGRVIFDYLLPSGNDMPDDPILTITSQYSDEIEYTVFLSRVHFPQLSLVSQDISATLLEEDCLRHPEHLSIRKYAQYAVGNPDVNDPSSDPDNREVALARVACQVSEDYVYDPLVPGILRARDIDMVNKRFEAIGICHNFSDLSAGLLRSLGLHTRDVMAEFRKIVYPSEVRVMRHIWNEVLVDEGGAQSSWIHFDATPKYVVDCKLCYSDPAQKWKWGDPVTVFADTVPMSNASYSLLAHDSEVKGVKACNPNLPDYSCAVCWMSMFPTIFLVHCAVDVKSEYEYTGGLSSVTAKSITAARESSVVLTMDAPLSVEKDGEFQLIGIIENVGESSIYNVAIGVGLRPWAADSLNTYFAYSPVILVDSLPAGLTDSVEWAITPLRTGNAVPLSVYAYDSSQTFWVSAELLQNINEPGTLPDLVMTASVSPGLVEPDETIDLSATVLDDSLQENTDAIVAAYITSETNPGFSDTVILTYSEPDSAYTSNLTLPSSAPVGGYICWFVAEEDGFDSDSIEIRFSVSAMLSVNAVSDSSVYDCRDTVNISVVVDDRGDTISEAIVYCEVITSLGSRVLSMEADSVSVYRLSFVPADFVPYMMDAATLPSGDWITIVSTDYFDSYAEDSISVLVNAPDFSIASSDISYFPSSPQDGDPVFVDALIRNIGTAQSDSTALRFFLNDTSSLSQVGADYMIPSLAAGDSAVISVMWNSSASVGDNEVYVKIDGDNLSIDSDRSNNLASATITVSAQFLCGDIDGSGSSTVDIADLVYLVDYMFNGGPVPPVMEAADVDGSGGNIDISDLVYLVDYMFVGGPPPVCQ